MFLFDAIFKQKEEEKKLDLRNIVPVPTSGSVAINAPDFEKKFSNWLVKNRGSLSESERKAIVSEAKKKIFNGQGSITVNETELGSKLKELRASMQAGLVTGTEKKSGKKIMKKFGLEEANKIIATGVVASSLTDQNGEYLIKGKLSEDNSKFYVSFKLISNPKYEWKVDFNGLMSEYSGDGDVPKAVRKALGDSRVSKIDSNGYARIDIDEFRKSYLLESPRETGNLEDVEGIIFDIKENYKK